MSIRCVSKTKNKNGVITAYLLEDQYNYNRFTVTAEQLKVQMMKGLKIQNLRLTSDYRIINHDDSEEIAKERRVKERIIGEYSGCASKAKLSYALNKTQSKRVGKLVTRAILLGLTCATLSGTLTACGTQPTTDVYAAQEVAETESPTTDELIDLLNQATTIDINVKIFSDKTKAVVSVGGTDIGTISGKIFKIWDTLKFVDENNTEIARGEQKAHLMFDGWDISDGQGNIKYTMKQELGLTTRYVIMDTDENEIAYLKRKAHILDDSAIIYDMDDNVIAEIKQGMLRRDFTIEIKDNSKIDNTSLVTICTNYITEKINENSRSHSSSNKNND